MNTNFFNNKLKGILLERKLVVGEGGDFEYCYMAVGDKSLRTKHGKQNKNISVLRSVHL